MSRSVRPKTPAPRCGARYRPCSSLSQTRSGSMSSKVQTSAFGLQLARACPHLAAQHTLPPPPARPAAGLPPAPADVNSNVAASTARCPRGAKPFVAQRGQLGGRCGQTLLPPAAAKQHRAGARHGENCPRLGGTRARTALGTAAVRTDGWPKSSRQNTFTRPVMAAANDFRSSQKPAGSAPLTPMLFNLLTQASAALTPTTPGRASSPRRGCRQCCGGRKWLPARRHRGEKQVALFALGVRNRVSMTSASPRAMRSWASDQSLASNCYLDAGVLLPQLPKSTR